MDVLIEFVGGQPLRRQLERQLREAIRAGRLAPGARLPASRELAAELGVSRGVVVECYSQLKAEGYLLARTRSGTRVAYAPPPENGSVRAARPEAASRRRLRYDLRPGQADFHVFPRRQWQAALNRVLRELPGRQLSYSDPRGVKVLREAVAEYVRRARAVVATTDQVVILCGLSHGLSALWPALRERGARRIGVEDPGWRWQTSTVAQAGLEPVPIAVDAEGLVVSELVAAGVDGVVLTPAHQYPTGVVLSPARRAELIEWARRCRTVVVEDDYDAEYRYDREPVAALQGLAPDVVVYAGTTSKTLAPALRVGWMVLPAHLVDPVAGHQSITAAQPPTIDQSALAGFIADGSLDRHLRQMRRRYREKRDLLRAAIEDFIPAAELSGAAGGLHLLVRLPAGSNERATAHQARRDGVAVHELHRHCTVHRPHEPALLLGYALPTGAEIRAGVQLIASALS